MQIPISWLILLQNWLLFYLETALGFVSAQTPLWQLNIKMSLTSPTWKTWKYTYKLVIAHLFSSMTVMQIVFLTEWFLCIYNWTNLETANVESISEMFKLTKYVLKHTDSQTT